MVKGFIRERAAKSGFLADGDMTGNSVNGVAHVRRDKKSKFYNCTCVIMNEFPGEDNVWCTPVVSWGQYMSYREYTACTLWNRKQVYANCCRNELCIHLEGNNGLAITAANLSLQCEDIKNAPYKLGFLAPVDSWLPRPEANTVDGQSLSFAPVNCPLVYPWSRS